MLQLYVSNQRLFQSPAEVIGAVDVSAIHVTRASRVERSLTCATA